MGFWLTELIRSKNSCVSIRSASVSAAASSSLNERVQKIHPTFTSRDALRFETPNLFRCAEGSQRRVPLLRGTISILIDTRPKNIPLLDVVHILQMVVDHRRQIICWNTTNQSKHQRIETNEDHTTRTWCFPTIVRSNSVGFARIIPSLCSMHQCFEHGKAIRRASTGSI